MSFEAFFKIFEKWRDHRKMQGIRKHSVTIGFDKNHVHVRSVQLAQGCRCLLSPGLGLQNGLQIARSVAVDVQNEVDLANNPVKESPREFSGMASHICRRNERQQAEKDRKKGEKKVSLPRSRSIPVNVLECPPCPPTHDDQERNSHTEVADESLEGDRIVQ